jgi:glyoxylase-like metal-dependent hydrolase (beta-lactamase superfamily II)
MSRETIPLEVADGVFRLPADFGPGGIVPNAVYLLRDAAILVDAGVDGTPSTHLAGSLARLGLSLDRVERLFVTHGHPDHFGGAAELRRASARMRIVCHEADQRWVEDHTAAFTDTYESFGDEWRPDEATRAEVLELGGPNVSVDETVRDGMSMELQVGGTVDVIHVPAHTPGSVLYHERSTDVVFAGDALQGRGVEIPRAPAVFPGYSDVAAYRASLDTLERLAPRFVATGHHGVLEPAGLQSHLAVSRAFTDELDKIVIAALRGWAGDVLLREIVAQVADSFPRHGHAYQIHQTVRAHLRGLVDTGLAAPGGNAGFRAT